MNGWKQYSVRDLIDRGYLFVGDGYRAKNSELSPDGIPFARAGNVNNGFQFEEDTDCFPLEDLSKVGNKVSQPFDIVFTSKGTVGRFAYVRQKTPRFVYSPQLCFWRCLNDSVIDSRFLYFWINGREFWEQVHAVKDQTDMADYVSLFDQRSMTITLPSLPEQETIAGVLSSLDDKIDLLHRQNKTLEGMAEAVYKHQFVDDREATWQECIISDLADHEKASIQPSKKPDTSFHHYSIPAFDETHMPICELGASIQSNKYRVNTNRILFSKLNPHRDKRIWLITGPVPDNSVCSTEFQAMKPRDEKHLFFLYGFVSYPDNYGEIAAGVGGTSGSHQRIDPVTIFRAKCFLPDDRTLKQYNEIAMSIFDKIYQNHNSIHTLSRLRDTLLPKLMSGETGVRNEWHPFAV